MIYYKLGLITVMLLEAHYIGSALARIRRSLRAMREVEK